MSISHSPGGSTFSDQNGYCRSLFLYVGFCTNMVDPDRKKIIIGVVGPCGSGKSTLIAGLRNTGFFARHIAQEHSYVPYMWKRISNPDLLIYLNASFESCTKRRKLNWTNKEYLEQLHRLSHAREHADLIIDTDSILPDEVLSKLIDFLKSKL